MLKIRSDHFRFGLVSRFIFKKIEPNQSGFYITYVCNSQQTARRNNKTRRL